MNAPTLRFKEFSESYKINTLKGLGIDGIKNGIQNKPGKNEEEIKFINVANLYSPNLNLNELEYINLQMKNLGSYRVIKGDIFFTRSSLKLEGIAHCNVYLDDYENIIFDDHIMRLRPNTKLVNPIYLRNYCLTGSARKYFMSRAKTGTMTTIGQEDISYLPIPTPSLSEQQKIADFFTLLDQRIEKQHEKVELLKVQKKGLMQKILSQGLRFKDDNGQDYPEWIFKKLEDYLIHLGSGVTPRGGSSVYTDSGVILIRSQNVYSTGLVLKDIAHISEEIHIKMKNSEVLPSDVLLNITGASIGRTTLVPMDFPKANVNQHVCIIRTKPSLNPSFLKFYLESPVGQKLIFQDQAGQTREALNLAQIRAFKVYVPSLKEQKKIALFLSVMDRKINFETQKLQQFQQQKQALMQQMFI
ncbi:restriction endonuclease subunit S [Peribacillus frigoritolerans]|uniref:restriction endonuclease subunit S n=1 Tax=Peribacillus frigoritolerans TaxID=450367 RepID=UPI00207A5E28|nr:restriction endonuclease subunit S [Peribacillus frigoritolerans]USK82564.1 restriction endonuclease subunit S [Peribacillus frigoritolerans]